MLYGSSLLLAYKTLRDTYSGKLMVGAKIVLWIQLQGSFAPDLKKGEQVIWPAEVLKSNSMIITVFCFGFSTDFLNVSKIVLTYLYNNNNILPFTKFYALKG